MGPMGMFLSRFWHRDTPKKSESPSSRSSDSWIRHEESRVQTYWPKMHDNKSRQLPLSVIQPTFFASRCWSRKYWGKSENPFICVRFFSHRHVVSLLLIDSIRYVFTQMVPQMVVPHGCSFRDNWVFPKIRVPQNGWFIMENPIF